MHGYDGCSVPMRDPLTDDARVTPRGEPEVIERPEPDVRAAIARFIESMQAVLDMLVQHGVIPSKLPAKGVGGDSLDVSSATQGVIAPQQPYGLQVEFTG